jgi:hypothetical protein
MMLCWKADAQPPGGDERNRHRSDASLLGQPRRCSSMAEHQLPKLNTRVRFPSSAPRNPLVSPLNAPKTLNLSLSLVAGLSPTVQSTYRERVCWHPRTDHPAYHRP